MFSNRFEPLSSELRFALILMDNDVPGTIRLQPKIAVNPLIPEAKNDLLQRQQLPDESLSRKNL
jgi:hypothetical protein